ncbi:hypothetical protein KGM_200667 [Danaus plexippus plexippus]|uniref:Uncharacterized protein n=1 Tax=Danaus plexippus plexippus TaxID=278856 RepID=A0A212FNF9_DANPL|nr:hypothetical protein KGM_200667 [Danaus plexippus plexippus]
METNCSEIFNYEELSVGGGGGERGGGEGDGSLRDVQNNLQLFDMWVICI